jgi:hypothetical protein
MVCMVKIASHNGHKCAMRAPVLNGMLRSAKKKSSKDGLLLVRCSRRSPIAEKAEPEGGRAACSRHDKRQITEPLFPWSSAHFFRLYYRARPVSQPKQ